MQLGAPRLYAGPVVDDLQVLVANHLRRAGQRFTPRRKVLIEALARAGRPVTAAELVAAEPRLPQSTAYQNLAFLEQAGVVRRVMGSDEFARFEIAEGVTGRHHHHLVCISCGAIEDFEAPRKLEKGLTDAIRQFTSGTGFRADTHRLDILGCCARCTG